MFSNKFMRRVTKLMPRHWLVACRSVACLSLLILVSACSQLEKKEPAISDAQLLKQQESIRLEKDFALALEMQREGDIERAKEAYRTILSIRPTLLTPRFNLAQIALVEKDINGAEEALAKVLTQRPDHKQALNLKGVIAREAGKFEEAEAFYRKALLTDPNYLPAIRNLAILLDLYMGRLTEALPLYEQYQSMLDEPDPKVKDWIFDLNRRLGDAS